MDGGYVPKDRIEQAETRGTKRDAPVPKARKDSRAYEVKKTDGPGVAAWRQRMAAEEGQEIDSQRGSTVETVNADLKMFRGLSRMAVRGWKRVRSQVLGSALAYNLMPFAKVWTPGVRENDRIPDGATEKGSAGNGKTRTGPSANDHPLSP